MLMPMFYVTFNGNYFDNYRNIKFQASCNAQTRVRI